MNYEVLTDSSSNLPLSLADEHRIRIIPLTYRTDYGEHQCIDSEAFDGDGYYDKIKSGIQVTTSQITPNQYAECFKPILDEGRDVLFVGISSGVSGTFSSACAAAVELREEYPDRTIELVDTLGASLGEGLIALRAAELRDADTPIVETAEQLRKMAVTMCQIFTVDDLMHLRRGGRLSNISAIVGTVLHIKPILIGNEEGKIVAIKKIRGRKRSIETLVSDYVSLVRNPERQLIGIAQAGCRADAALLEKLLMASGKPPKKILTVQYEPVTGAHVGPGALALFFLSDKNVRQLK